MITLLSSLFMFNCESEAHVQSYADSIFTRMTDGGRVEDDGTMYKQANHIL